MNRTRLTHLAEQTVVAAQRRLPPEVRDIAAAVPVCYEAGPQADLLADGADSDLLGLFVGHAHGEELAEAQPLPPQILLFLDNLWDYAGNDVETYRDEVRLTYLHELGHYLGWDEDDIASRGLD